MGHARTFLAVAALWMHGCATPRPREAGPLFERCLVSDTTAATPDTVHAIAVLARQSTPDCERRAIAVPNSPVVIAITPPSGADLRDVLEGRAAGTRRPDVVVTQDPQLIDLARRSGGYLVEPLPWNTTYALVTRTNDRAAMPELPERDALARDVVTADSRGAVGPFPWFTDSSCVTMPDFARTTSVAAVGWSSDDPIARALAERLASLSASQETHSWIPLRTFRSGLPWRASPVARDSIVTALVSGRIVAAVIAIPRDPSTSCGVRNDYRVPRGAIPLVDARPHVIVRRGSGAAFIVGVDGTLHFVKRGTR